MFLTLASQISGDDSSAVDCLSRFPLSILNPTVIISALGVHSFDAVKSKSAKISFLFQDMPSKIPIWLFNDNTWDMMHGRGKLHTSDFHLHACMIDVFRAEPWLLNISQNGGAIDRYYDFAGYLEPCDQPLRMKRYVCIDHC